MVGRVVFNGFGAVSLLIGFFLSFDKSNDVGSASVAICLLGVGLMLAGAACGAAEGGRQRAAAMTRLAEVTQWKVTAGAQQNAGGAAAGPPMPAQLMPPQPMPGQPIAGGYLPMAPNAGVPAPFSGPPAPFSGPPAPFSGPPVA